MGHDITALSNHNLNTSNIETLAHDLSTRLDYNIEYGYFAAKNFCELLGEEFIDDFVCINKVIVNKSFVTARLIDDDYQSKKVLEKFGEEIFKNPKYWDMGDNYLPSTVMLDLEKKSLLFCVYDFFLNGEYDGPSIIIYNHLFENNTLYFTRWYPFCNIFMDQNIHEPQYDFAKLMEYRTNLKFYMHKLGGNKMYYLDDQSHVFNGVGQGSEYEMTWDELENYVKEKGGRLILDVQKYFADVKYKQHWRNIYINGNTHNDLPLAFVDNFSDL